MSAARRRRYPHAVVDNGLAGDAAAADPEPMTEPWAGDTDMRRMFMRERFGDPKALNRERTKPNYRPRKVP